MSSSSSRRSRQDPNAFPWRQLIVLSLCRVCEPIAFMSIFPYIYYMVESFHITNDDKQIAMYAGMVTSAFALAEALSGSIWGRLSDKVGRKPILICGLAGTGLSMLLFGFAPSLPVAILARAIGGLLNGNIGVLQTTVAEVVTVEEHRPVAFALFPTVWCVGSIVGSILGGTLADPVRSYPNLFSPGSLLDRFPYLLPNLVCASVVAIGMVLGVLFLEETHEDLQERRDVGLEIGDRLVAFFTWKRPADVSSAKGSDIGFTPEDLALLHEEMPPDYKSTASSPELQATAPGLPPPSYQDIDRLPSEDVVERGDAAVSDVKQTSGVWNSLTRQVIYNIVGFGILAYHTISAEQLLPVLFSLPESTTPPTLPFWFTGGFALPTKSIGGILSIQAVMQMIATGFVFPMVQRRLGTLTTYRLVILSYPLLYILIPYLTLVPVSQRMPAVYAILVWKVTAQAFAYPANNLMLVNQSPKRTLGTFNGFSCSAASASRAIGPTVSGLLQATGLARGILGLPWWCNALVALLGAVLSLFMVETKHNGGQAARVHSEKAPRGPLRGGVAAGDDEEVAAEPDINAAVVVAESPHTSTDNISSRPASPLLVRGSATDVRRSAARPGS